MKRSHDENNTHGGGTGKRQSKKSLVPPPASSGIGFSPHPHVEAETNQSHLSRYDFRHNDSINSESGAGNTTYAMNALSQLPAVREIEEQSQQFNSALLSSFNLPFPAQQTNNPVIGSMSHNVNLQQQSPLTFETMQVGGNQSNELQQMATPNYAQLLRTQQQQNLHSENEASIIAALFNLRDNSRNAAMATSHATICMPQQQNEIDLLQRDVRYLQYHRQNQQRMDEVVPFVQPVPYLSLADNILALHQQNQILYAGLGNRMLQQGIMSHQTRGRSIQDQIHQPFAATSHPFLSSVAGIQSQEDVTNCGVLSDESKMEATPPLSLPVLLSLSHCNDDLHKLSEHQCLLRQQIQVFEAGEEDAATHTRGRNKAIMIGQVGIRCKHCTHVAVSRRQKGSTYFPATIFGIYQAAQNMSSSHIQCGLCSYMPDSIKLQFKHVMENRHRSPYGNGAGRTYWARCALQLGLVDTEEHGIRFKPNIPPDATIVEDKEHTPSLA